MDNNHFAVVLSSPTSVDVSITRKCNHKCIHCYNTWRTDDADERRNVEPVPDEKIEKIFDELEANDIWRVTVTGGEPLSAKNVLRKFIEESRKRNIDIGMNTNLTLMTDDLALELSNYGWKTALLTSLPGVTPEVCDSVTQVPGSFDRIVKGIRIRKKHGLLVGINVVVSRENLFEVDKLFDFLDKNPVDYVSITRAVAPLYDMNNPAFFLDSAEITHIAETLERIHDRYGCEVGSITPFPLCVLKDVDRFRHVLSASCAAGITRCCIDAVTGDITACTHESTPYGNIYTEGLTPAWEKMSEWRNGQNVNSECRKCSMLQYCGGECRMIAGTEKHVKYNLNRNVEVVYTIKEPPAIDKASKFIVSHECHSRREPFGGVIQHGYNECYVSDSVMALHDVVQRYDSISYADFLEFCEESPFLDVAIRELCKMGILKKIQ